MCWQAWQADPTPCGTGTACSARASPVTTRAPFPTASSAAAGTPRRPLQRAGHRRRMEDQVDLEQLPDQVLRPGQPRCRLHPGVRDQAGLQRPDQAVAWRTWNSPVRSATPRPPSGPRTPAACSIQIPATASGRTGRHIVYTIWQASHLDQSYYLCSDVDFGGGAAPASYPRAARSASASIADPSSARHRPAAASAHHPGPAGGCSATYRVTSPWNGGFQGEVDVTAGATAIKGWTVNWTYAGGQQLTRHGTPR